MVQNTKEFFMADLIQSVQDMLKEETWTRATISNYTQNNLKELANIVEQAKNENNIREVYSVCSEHLAHTKDSIIALYICGILDLQKGALDNSSLETLVDIFQNNHKENIVNYLCESILEDDPNNKFALRKLAEIYSAENNDKVWDLYAKLVKIDFKEAELAKILAEHFETTDPKKAIEFYKKAILRYVNNNNYNGVKEVWTKLVLSIPQEIDFFQLVRGKIAKTMGEIKTTTLMQELYNWYKDNENWDTAIMILKENLEVEPKDTWARKEITDCFRAKYKDNPHTEDYIRSSNLTANYRNVFEAINDFEKHIAFTKGKHVFHRTWGVGKIVKLENDNLYINFGATGGKKIMKLSMAVSALKPLEDDHIWVLKAYDQNGELAKKVKSDKKWALKTIILSFDNNCDFKRIKAELVPSILKATEWTAWNTAAKRILESDAEFGVNPNDINMYKVRDHEISAEEKLHDEFKAEKQFFSRLEILVKFFESEETDNGSELFTEMYSYFTGYLKNISKVTEQVLASYLLVKDFSAQDKQFLFPVKETFADIYSKIEDPREIYTLLKDSKNTHLREDFLRDIKLLPEWNKEYIRLFPTVLDHKLLDTLINEGHKEDVQELVRTAFEKFKDYRETVLFFFKECQDKDWYKETNISFEKQLITLINILEVTFREINNHVNTTENKKINKNATALLFTDEALFGYMFAADSDEDRVKKMYTLIDDIVEIDPSHKAVARAKILEKYPDFKFRVHITEEKSSQSSEMLVTAEKLEEKKAEAKNIQDIELPENAKDIADARAKGDLKENAEYHAARERQHFLQNRLKTLQNELNRAVVFDPTTSTTAVISFATVVTLTNNKSGKDESYTILGPWESDPENNIISYMSPFGDPLMNKKVGDNVKFTANDESYDYTVKAIKKAVIK